MTLSLVEKKRRAREQKKIWYVENKDKHKASMRKYYAKNKETIYAKNRAWIKQNRDKVRGYGRDWARRNKEKNLRTRLRITFGLTLEEFNGILAEQNGVCAICAGVNKKKRLCVDHDHKTGIVRGLLCDRCNHGIGHFMDDTGLMKKAISYLNAVYSDNCNEKSFSHEEQD